MSVALRRWRWVTAVGAIACVAVLTVIIVTTRRQYIWLLPGRLILLTYGGGFVVGEASEEDARFWDRAGKHTRWPFYLDTGKDRIQWRFQSWRITPGELLQVYIPPWGLLATAALPTAYAWHRCRRYPPGHCRKCGYDLAGIAAGVCPECGKAAREAMT